MILEKYFLNRFLRYFVLMDLLLGFLFNFIEFFEKLTHVKSAQVQTILHFVSLNLIPSFFDLMPISAWLAAILIIRELSQQNEFEIMQILSIGHKKLFKLFAISGLCAAMICFAGRETFVSTLAAKSEKFKTEKLKNQPNQILLNKWIPIGDNTFCFLGSLNLETNIGKNFLILQMSPFFDIKKTIAADAFCLNPKVQYIEMESGSICEIESNKQTVFKKYSLQMPSFFGNLRFIEEKNNLLSISRELIFFKNIVSEDTYNELLYKFLKHLFVYLEIILYPLLVLGLFVTFLKRSYFCWLSVFMPYPLIILASTISDKLVQHGLSAWYAGTNYLLLSLLIGLFYYLLP